MRGGGGEDANVSTSSNSFSGTQGVHSQNQIPFGNQTHIGA